MTSALTRRHLLTAALGTGAAVPLGSTAPGWAAPARLARITHRAFPEVQFIP